MSEFFVELHEGLSIGELEAEAQSNRGNAESHTKLALHAAQSAFYYWLEFYQCAAQLQVQKAHRQRGLTWADYCKQILGVHDSRVRQLKKAYPYAQALIAAGITDLTEADLRHIPKGITHDNPDLLAIFEAARKAMSAVFGNQAAPTAQVYNAVLNVLETAQVTGGYVDTGDGSMTPLEAAVELKVQESILQQREYIRSGGKWEELERKSWRCNEPGALGIVAAAGLTVDAQDTDIEIVVIVRKARTDETL